MVIFQIKEGTSTEASKEVITQLRQIPGVTDVECKAPPKGKLSSAVYQAKTKDSRVDGKVISHLRSLPEIKFAGPDLKVGSC